MTKLAGPIRQEPAVFRFKIREREVMVDRLHDPDDQLEVFARGVIPKKLDVLSLQLACMGVGEAEAESLLRRLASLEKFKLMEVSQYLDIICARVGNFSDPVFVIEAVTDNVSRMQPDGKHALAMAMALYRDFALLNDPERETEFAAKLKGN